MAAQVSDEGIHLDLLVTLLFRSWQDEPSSPLRWDSMFRIVKGKCLTVIISNYVMPRECDWLSRKFGIACRCSHLLRLDKGPKRTELIT